MTSDDMLKTNAMRMLDKAKISYETFEYTCESDEQIGLQIAEKIKVIKPSQCFKTLVARGEKKGIVVFCIPVTEEVDLKAAAKVCGDKKVELTHVKELFDLTGYIRGGCSPIGMKKSYPVFIDSSCLDYDKVGVSGGMKGVQLILSPSDLIKFTRAKTGNITRMI